MVFHYLKYMRYSTIFMVLLLTACSQDIDCIQYGWKYESIQNTWFMGTESGSPIQVAQFNALSGVIKAQGRHYEGNYCLTDNALYFYQYRMTKYGLWADPIKIKMTFYEPRKMELTFDDGKHITLFRPRD